MERTSPLPGRFVTAWLMAPIPYGHDRQGGGVGSRAWDSDCGGFQDFQYYRHNWWIDGIDA